MHRILLFIFSTGICCSVWGQKASTYSSNKDADPKAKLLLKQVKDKLNLSKGVEISFDFRYAPAESTPAISKGNLSIRNKKFILELGDQILISNEKTVWTYLPKRNEVQLQYALDIEADPMSPFKLLQIHDAPDFTYVLAGDQKINGIVYDMVEFKPLDKNAEFFKIKAEIDRVKKLYKKIVLYLKNGDQYELLIKTQVSKALPDSLFNFDPAKYPGVKTEDLR